MQKAKIQTLTHLRDKGDAKIYMVTTEDGLAGEYYSHKGEAPFKVGDEVECSVEQSDFGPKFKLASSGGGGGFKAKQWTPEQVAQQDAVKITAAALQGGALKVEDYKIFFGECKQFMIESAKAEPLPF